MDCGILGDVPKAKIKLFNQNLNILFYEYDDNNLKLHLEQDIVLSVVNFSILTLLFKCIEW